ncbi:MAG: amidase domain-containing protein [Halanaerobiales bacterium]|nr:amidase domain-containing protein [Halanaerobiales bacterium]
MRKSFIFVLLLIFVVSSLVSASNEDLDRYLSVETLININSGDLEIYQVYIKKIINDDDLSNNEKLKIMEMVYDKYSIKSYNFYGRDSNESFARTKLILDKAFEERLKTGKEIEKQVGKIINRFNEDDNYLYLATSVIREDKIKVMYSIIEIIQTDCLSISERNLLEHYIRKFLPYAGDEKLIEEYEQCKKESFNIFSVSTSNFDRWDTAQYATDYYYYYNTPTYPDLNGLGGDCANFVSQCLNAGGIAMDTTGGWYIRPKVTNPMWDINTVSDLNDNWNLADPSPWISAEEFNNYWSYNAFDHESWEPADLLISLDQVYDKAWSGDVIQIMKKVLWWYEGYHTMIVTGYNNPDLLMTYHTTDTENKSLTTIINAYNSSSYKFDIMYIIDGF